MAEYTEEQTKQLRDRWKGHEEELRVLVSVIKTDPKWEKSQEYRSLMKSLGGLPKGLMGVERDLRGSYLRGMDLSESILERVDLSGAVLERANLSQAFLVGADLSKAFLERANLSGAVLERGDLSHAFLEKANLLGAILERANLSQAFLVGVDLSKAFLVEAILSGANLWGANLSGANLWGANLSGANLWGAGLSGANLERASLPGANLENANLPGAELRGANLSGAYLGNANLSGANLREATLYGTYLVRADLSNTKSWVGVRWNSKNRSWLQRNHLKPSQRKTVFDANDIRNANWTGMMLLKRYIEDENFLNEYIRADLPLWGRVLRWLWKWTCDYGRSFRRWALISLGVLLTFGFILFLMRDQLYFSTPMIRHDWITPFYYSIVTFTTLGFGDVTPLTKWAMLAIGFEVLTGYIMLGGLISICTSKLARRAP